MSTSNRSTRRLLMTLCSLALIAGLWRWRQSERNASRDRVSTAREVTAPVALARAKVRATPPAAPAIPEVASAPAAKPATASQTSATAAGATQSQPQAPASTTPAVGASSIEPTDKPEVQATRRMYAAHAPLRTREVADPDSETNRAVVQTMLQKSLARAQQQGAKKP